MYYVSMYVCMYICMYVCMCMYVYMYLCMYVYVCMYVRTYTYVCIYVCMYVCAHSNLIFLNHLIHLTYLRTYPPLLLPSYLCLSECLSLCCCTLHTHRVNCLSESLPPVGRCHLHICLLLLTL
jgi:nuclear pore complex protein Nup62